MLTKNDTLILHHHFFLVVKKFIGTGFLINLVSFNFLIVIDIQMPW